LTPDIPEQFHWLLSSCWDPNPDNRISFESIVLSFLRRELTLTLSASSQLRLRDYESRVVSQSFVAGSLVAALNNLCVLRTEGDQLRDEVDVLQQALVTASASLTSFLGSAAARKEAISPSLSGQQLDVRNRAGSVSIGDPPSAFSGPGRIAKQMSSTQLSLALLPALVMASSPPEGLFARLAREHGGNINVAREGLVTITGNSLEAGRDADLAEIVNPEWGRCWTSQNVEESWVQFDFGTRQVSVTSYSIKTYPCVRNYSHLRSWVLEGCQGQSFRWFQLDARDDNHELNGRSKMATFNCHSSTFCNFVRLRQTGANHHNDHYLVLTNVEFFGEMLG
jgi:hypothetical protein